MDCKDIPQHIRDSVQGADDKAKVIDELAAANARRKKLLHMRVAKHEKLIWLIDTHPKGPLAGLDAIISNDTWAKAQNSNVEYKQKALQGYAEKFIPTLKQELSSKMLGFKVNKELGRDFVRAVIDGAAGNAKATKMAGEAKQMLDFLRRRFNEYGGDIGTLRAGKGYLPQMHDAVAIRNTPKEEWIKFITPLLDDLTRADIELGRLDLGYVYDTITTGGLNKIKEGGSFRGAGKSVANKHAEERVLDFKDADAWLAYQERFGGADPMAALDNHIRTMTTDMALIETLGPNPDNMFRTLVDQVVAKKTMKGEKSPAIGIGHTKAMYEVISGKVDRDVGEFALAPHLQVFRAINTATLLNSAALSSITDPLLAAFTAGYQGMNPLKTLGGYAKNIVRGASKRTFEEEQLMGLGADVFSSQVTQRFSELGAGFWAKASEAVMRATMMNILTESSRMSFKAQFFKKLLGNRKISDLTVDEHIALLEKVQQEADYAVVMGNSRARAMSTAGMAKGTAGGEITRSSTQFLTFPATFMVMQGSRIFRQGNFGSRAAYAAGLFTILTMGGAVAMMGKDASKGYGVRKGFNPLDEDNDPEDVAKFWAAAAAQGGGIGIVGDFLFSDVNRFGGGGGVTVLGPSMGTAADFGKLTYGNIQEAFNPEVDNTHFGSELVDFTNRHLNPVKTWYTHALWENYVVRTLKIMADEDYEKAERIKDKKRRKEYGQEPFEWIQESRESVQEAVGE